MPDRLALPERRLRDLNASFPQLQRVHTLITKDGETAADLKARKERMIAEGQAHPDDYFIHYIIVDPPCR